MYMHVYDYERIATLMIRHAKFLIIRNLRFFQMMIGL